ncbi:hypothetical protein O181_023583 [Austropuccinia psidii MF-1]|uniref:Uncharacterized protein n=1 Tax=Austropuccinia psidii MF-1 TaxID=1389203 RepID=A0A9Q3CJ26_9BASI|nr:hypothetical protein [Austropuccinia psidii MF-1]
MSPSPAHSKPPPPQLFLLMNPLPDPPDKNNHMISPQIYEERPGFFNQAISQTKATTLILEKKIGQHDLPNNLTTLLTRLCKKIESLKEKQKETEKMINHHNRNSKNPSPITQEPSPLEQNRFKKISIVIHTKFGATNPFKDKTTRELYNKVNKALMEVNAKQDNNPVQIKAIIKYPSGDVQIFTKTKAEARWLLDNRATWTHLADPVFVMSPTSYPVIVHSCPTFLDFDDEICMKAFLKQNEIAKDKFLCIQWLGHPKEEEKSHGMAVIQLTDKTTAKQLLQGGLIFDGTFMQILPYTPGPHRCFNFPKKGHKVYQCKDNPTCIKCGEATHPRLQGLNLHTIYQEMCMVH